MKRSQELIALTREHHAALVLARRDLRRAGRSESRRNHAYQQRGQHAAQPVAEQILGPHLDRREIPNLTADALGNTTLER